MIGLFDRNTRMLFGLVVVAMIAGCGHAPNSGPAISVSSQFAERPLTKVDLEIIESVRFNQTDRALKLLERHGSWGLRDEDGLSLLHWAASTVTDLDFLAVLIEHGADVNDASPPASWARELDSSAAYESDEFDPRLNTAGRTPLHHAVMYRGISHVEFLLARGAEIDPRTDSGMTPLHYAAIAAYDEIVAVLLKNAADVHARSNSGLTPLHFAMVDPTKVGEPGDHVATIRHLLKGGADTNARDHLGRTPAAFARHNGCYDCILNFFAAYAK